MSKDLQHIDDIFRDAIEPHKGKRSAAVWESLEARLDKDDATTYRKRFIVARRVAITLLLLLISFVIYETGLNKSGSQKFAGQKGSQHAGTNKPGYEETERTRSIKSPEINNNQKGSSANPPVPFNNNKKLDSSRQLSGKPALANKAVFLQESNTVKSDYLPDKIILLQKDKTDFVNTLKGHTNKRHTVYKSDKLKTMYLTRWNFNKNNNTAIGGYKVNEAEKVPVTKNNFLLTGKIISSIQPFYTDVNTDLIFGEHANITPFSKLILPGSLNPPVTKIQQLKKKQGSSFKPYWTVTAIASPEWTQYNLENDVPDNGGNLQDDKTQIEQRENHELSFSAGILASYQFKKHWAIQTGLLYSNTAITIDPQTIYAAKESNGQIAYKYNASSGYAFVTPGFGLPAAVGDSITTSSAQHNLQYISIPVMLKYKIEWKRFSIAPGIGISTNFLTSAKIQTEIVNALNTETVTISKLEGTKPFYLGLMANADIQYNINKRWSLNVMPTFRYAVTTLTKSNVVKTYPYSFGIGAGLSYRF